MTRKPDLFIVGAPKSGTTSVYEHLSGHPEVYMSSVKEPLYFCPDIGDPQRRLPVHPNEAGYLALFEGATHERRLGEASTRYLLSVQAPLLIRDFQPRPFVVAMLRNPVDMIYALHNERVSQGHEPVEDFKEALARDDDRYAGRDNRGAMQLLSGGYRREGMYAEQLERWFAAVGRERVRVIIFDDFVADAAHEFELLLGFLEVDPTYRPGTFEARNTSHRQRPWVRRLVDSGPADWAVQTALPVLVGQQRKQKLVYEFRHSRLNRKPAPRPPMAADLRASLETDFQADTERLSKMLDRDLAGLWFGRT